MGRKKSLQNEGKFLLITSKGANKQGEYHLHLQYTIDRKQAIGGTGVWLKEKDWDAVAQKVKTSNAQATRLNNLLRKKKAEIDGWIIEYSATKRITVEDVRDMVQGNYDPNAKEKTDFMELVEVVLTQEYKTQKLAYSTYYNAKKYMGNFAKFVKEKTGKDDIDVCEVTEELIDANIIWRKEGRNNCNETINKTLTPIIKGLNAAVGKDLIPAARLFAIKAKYLTAKERLTEEDLEDETIDYLTMEQLVQFSAMWEKVKYLRTRDYMDMFLFSFHACGLRFSDILTLQWKHIDEQTKILRKVMFKGHNKILNLQLTDPAVEILERWKKKTGGHTFVFGLLPDDFDLTDEAELDKQRQNKSRAVRTSLTEIGNKMGLGFNLRMHVARHTFAVQALEKLRDVYMVSTLLGHRSVEVTQKVYAKFLPDTLHEEVKSKLTFDLTPKNNTQSSPNPTKGSK